jgi:predicted nucleic acid-binding protein
LIPAVTILAVRDRARETEVAVVAQHVEDGARAGREDLRRLRQRLLDRAQVAFATGDCGEARTLASALEQEDATSAADIWLAAVAITRECRKRSPDPHDF